MYSLGRLSRAFGFCSIPIVFGVSALLAAPFQGSHAARAAAEPPLTGFWNSVQPNAPVKNLHVTVLPVLVNGEPSGRLLYVVAAYGQRGEIGSRAVAVPPLASTPVTVRYQSATTCIPSGNLCRPIPIPRTTTLTMVPVGAAIRMTVTTRTLGPTATTSSEILIHPFG